MQLTEQPAVSHCVWHTHGHVWLCLQLCRLPVCVCLFVNVEHCDWLSFRMEQAQPAKWHVFYWLLWVRPTYLFVLKKKTKWARAFPELLNVFNTTLMTVFVYHHHHDVNRCGLVSHGIDRLDLNFFKEIFIALRDLFCAWKRNEQKFLSNLNLRSAHIIVIESSNWNVWHVSHTHTHKQKQKQNNTYYQSLITVQFSKTVCQLVIRKGIRDNGDSVGDTFRDIGFATLLVRTYI